jgi:hypothetical protein
MSEISEQLIQAFTRQCEEYVPMPIEEAEDLLDLPKKSREQILLDIHVQDFVQSRPQFRNKPPGLVRMIVRQFLVQQGIL